MTKLPTAPYFRFPALRQPQELILGCGEADSSAPSSAPSAAPMPSGACSRDRAAAIVRGGTRPPPNGCIGLKAAPENYNRDAILRHLKQLEAYGVTTVMALGLNGPLFYELRPELHAGRLPGADLFGADQGIGVVGGQPFGSQPPVGENQVSRPDTVEMARASIRQMAARKTDMVKIWLDSVGGLMPKLKPEVYSAVIDEAHKNGLRVAAHIYDLDDAKAIVRAGVDIIAHGVRDKPGP
jgi:hypothetical protein